MTHLDKNNNPHMVDVSQKDITQREASAEGKIFLSKEAFGAVMEQKTKKGAVLQSAIIAAIMGAKRTSELIPLCHLLALSLVECDIEALPNELGFVVRVKVKTKAQTGVEMEALMGVSIGLLTIYDMVKALDKKMLISEICLVHKSGGKSGEFVREQKA